MLTGSDIQKRVKMSNADCIITDASTAMKIDDDVALHLTKKIFVEGNNGNDLEKEYMQKMESKGKNNLYPNIYCQKKLFL